MSISVSTSTPSSHANTPVTSDSPVQTLARERRLLAEEQRTDVLLRIVETSAQHVDLSRRMVSEIHAALSERMGRIEVCMAQPLACRHRHHATPVDDATRMTSSERRLAAMDRLEAVIELIVAARDRAGVGIPQDLLDELQDTYETRLERLIDAQLAEERHRAKFGAHAAFRQLRSPQLVSTTQQL